MESAALHVWYFLNLKSNLDFSTELNRRRTLTTLMSAGSLGFVPVHNRGAVSMGARVLGGQIRSL